LSDERIAQLAEDGARLPDDDDDDASAQVLASP
jgi:hypothetical protein